jgi:multiple sugar transport system ATP-binding protein
MVRIELRNFRKEFPVSGGVEVAVDDIDLEIGDGELVTLVGPSGCGKTTTLRCLAGLETPTSGQILFDGTDVTDLPANKRNVAMMFQNIALYPHMTVTDNIAYPLKIRSVPPEIRREKAREAAEKMQIPELLDKHPAELSGGQRQRAALARTVSYEPDVFLMDEPLSDLDAKLKIKIRKEIQQLQKDLNKTTIYVTHDQEEAMTMSDRIAVMNNGRVLQYGTPDELYRHPNNQFVATFIGNPSMNFLSSSVESVDGDTASLSIEEVVFDCELEVVDRLRETMQVKIGFRPESIRIGSEIRTGDFRGKIKLIERIGDRLLATVEGPQGDLSMTISADNNLQEDETIPFEIDKTNIYVFDRDSGKLVAKGTNVS